METWFKVWNKFIMYSMLCKWITVYKIKKQTNKQNYNLQHDKESQLTFCFEVEVIEYLKKKRLQSEQK